MAMAMIERVRAEEERVDRLVQSLFWDEEHNCDPLEPWIDDDDYEADDGR